MKEHVEKVLEELRGRAEDFERRAAIVRELMADLSAAFARADAVALSNEIGTTPGGIDPNPFRQTIVPPRPAPVPASNKNARRVRCPECGDLYWKSDGHNCKPPKGSEGLKTAAELTKEPGTKLVPPVPWIHLVRYGTERTFCSVDSSSVVATLNRTRATCPKCLAVSETR